MKTNLSFDFNIDKANKTVFITREFNSDLSDVWDAFTKPELIDQWIAPKPFTARTKFMTFKVGGSRLYAMVSPDGQEQYSLQEYLSISPKTNFKYKSSFADKDGKADPQWPGSEWDLSFSEQGGTTTVSITIVNQSLARMEKMIEMGFKEGFIMSMNNLEELLK